VIHGIDPGIVLGSGLKRKAALVAEMAFEVAALHDTNSVCSSCAALSTA
jgi:hypothetical protein